MRRYLSIIIALGLALLVAGAGAQDSGPPAAATPAPESVQILYVPVKDLPRAPGYSDEGTLAPLSELLALAARAAARSDAASKPAGLSITGLTLDGRAGDILALDGTLEWICTAEDWTAAVLDDGAWPWTLVEGAAPSDTTTAPSQGLLVRTGGKTVLLAKGQGRGSLPVRAVWPLDKSKSIDFVALGGLQAPARMQIILEPGTSLHSAERCVARKDAPAADGSRRVTIWPLRGEASILRLERAPVLSQPDGAPAIQSLTLHRWIIADSGGIQVHDTLTMTGDFKSGQPLELTLPEDLLLMSTRMHNPATVDTPQGRLIITPREDFTELQLQANFAAEVTDGEAAVGAWVLPAVQQKSFLFLRPSETQLPVPAVLTPEFVATTTHDGVMGYDVWGPLSAMTVRLVPRRPDAAPALAGELRLRRNEATLRYTITQIDARAGEVTFLSPDGWTLTGAEARAGEAALPWAFVHAGGNRWRLVFGSDARPDAIELHWHRAGQWGVPGEAAPVALPLLALEGPRSLAHTLAVHWPEEFEVRPEGLRDLAFEPIKPIDTHPFTMANQGQQGVPAQQPQQYLAQAQHPVQAAMDLPELALRVSGEHPAGSLAVRGRESSRRATVVTLLSIDESRARVRSMIAFVVRFAPASTFRFALPAGTGRSVKIDGEGIRETTLHSGPDADVWTVVTQHGVLGSFRVTAEWTLAEGPDRNVVEAPEIRALDVTSQRGFLVLEGSETLRLTPETKNLAEADLSDVPPTPWSRNIRALAVYRYVEPPYALTLKTDKFVPEPALEGLVEEARLTTSAGRDGQRLTRAEYTFRPVADRQFFEVTLPAGAQLWAALVDGEGVKPARQAGAANQTLLVPLPGQAARGATVKIALIYREQGAPLASLDALTLPAPAPAFPVNKSVWTLNLPQGFEYLRFAGVLVDPVQPRQPALSFLRTAYYPDRLVFESAGVRRIIAVTVFLLFVYWLVRRAVAGSRKGREGKPKPPAGAAAMHVGFRLIEVFIVLGIIAILAAIAVPNFLEAQVRSKVSRVKSDQRTLATALEAYYVDNNAYPVNPEILWQGPVKYLGGAYRDPYAGDEYSGEAGFKYVYGREAADRAMRAGLIGPEQAGAVQWLAYSVGPDGKDDLGAVIYDPTNGTVSEGDIVRFNLGAPSTFQASFTPRLQEEMAREALVQSELGMPAAPTQPAPAGAAYIFDPTNGTISSGDVWRVKNGDKPPAEKPVPAASVPIDINGFDRVGRVEGSLIELDRWAAAQAARRAGLLSLAVEVPEGGVQRRLEALGAESELRINLMPWERFKRLQFLVWIAALLVMGALWARAGAQMWAARAVFIIAVAVTLFTPVIVKTAWAPFFNAALQGVVFSLIVPLGILLWRLTLGRLNSGNDRKHGEGGRSRAAMTATTILSALIIMTLMPTGPATAQETTPPPVATPDAAAAIIVPYQPGTPPLAEDDPLGWMSQAEFTRLWETAHQTPAPEFEPRPYMATLRWDGALNVDRNVVQGRLVIEALNAGGVPAEWPLRMQGLSLENARSTPPGAAIVSWPEGLRLQMGPRWAGRLEAEFTLPVTLTGREGRLELEMPEAGAGQWSVALPWPRVELLPGSAPAVIRETPDGSTLSGAARPGKLMVAWRGNARRAEVSGAAGTNWRAQINILSVWDSLAGAAWSAGVTLQPAEAGTLLPREVRLRLDPGVSIVSAAGSQLAAVRVPGSSGGDVTLELRPCAEAEITLSGVMETRFAEMGRWALRGLRAPEGIQSDTRVTLNIIDQIEILGATPAGLRRQAAREVPQNYATQTYEAIAPDWSLTLMLRRLLPAFEAATTELIMPRDGQTWSATRVDVQPRASVLNGLQLGLPDGAQALNVTGGVAFDWVQSGRIVWIRMRQPVEQPFALTLTTRAPLAAPDGALAFAPITVPDATEQKRSLVIGVAPDVELREETLRGADPRSPSALDRELAGLIETLTGEQPAALRAYDLKSGAPLEFRLLPVAATALVQAFNLTTISEGVQSLQCELRVTPRRGRLERVEALLLLPAPDPEAAARLEASGPVRHVEKEMLSDTVMRLVAELRGPQSQPITLRFQLDTRANTESGQTLRAAAIRPEGGTGARALLQVRRAFEGEMTLKDAAGAAILDRSGGQTAGMPFALLPADHLFELSMTGGETPLFAITRHAQQQALRAIVEVLRERVILTADGFERHELEIVLQNQSEQFLRVALPYPASQVNVYEARVAGRVVKTSFAQEGGREALLLPLIRTGLLEPELTVRVAYTVTGQPALKRRGTRTQQLPEILGGVPVAQSALVLMLPGNFEYSKFDGTLNRVELVDLELDDVLRRSKKLEQISEAALYAGAETRVRALSKVQEMQKTVEFGYKQAQQTVEASGRAISARQQMDDKAVRDESEIQQRLAGKRVESLEQAQLAQQNIFLNVARLDEIVQQQAQTGVVMDQPALTEVAAPVTPIYAEPVEFPRSGTVFVFRQLQGTGQITFRFASQEVSARRWDALFGIALLIGLGLVAGLRRQLFATRQRTGAVIIAACAGAILFQAALDLAIPGLAIGAIVWLSGRRASRSTSPHFAATPDRQ